MKFDVVVGNPPYQSNNGSGILSGSGPSSLWARFVEKAIACTKDNGHIGFITPDGIFRSSNASFSIFKGENIALDVQYISDSTSQFNVGQDIVSWVLNKAPYKGTTIFDGESVDLAKFPIVPKNGHSIYLKVIYKINDFGTLNFTTGDQISPNRVSDAKTSATPYALNANGKIKYTSIKSKIYDKPKVMVGQLADWSPIFSNEMSNSPSTMRMLVKNKAQGKRLISLLKSKLYSFVVNKQLRVSGRLTWAINTLPVLDLTRAWTDSELYAHFNLTQAEIDYIEANVK